MPRPLAEIVPLQSVRFVDLARLTDGNGMQRKPRGPDRLLPARPDAEGEALAALIRLPSEVHEETMGATLRFDICAVVVHLQREVLSPLSPDGTKHDHVPLARTERMRAIAPGEPLQNGCRR